MGKILGALTVIGLGLLATAYWAQTAQIAYPTPIILLGVGATLSLLAGLPWAHRRGWRWLKAAYLGFVGFAVSAPLGAYCGDVLSPTGPEALGISILMLIGGFWVGGLLFGILGFWWGIRFHRGFRENAPAPA